MRGVVELIEQLEGGEDEDALAVKVGEVEVEYEIWRGADETGECEYDAGLVFDCELV